MSLVRAVVVLLIGFSVACGCSEVRRTQVPDGGLERPTAAGGEEEDGGRALVRTITCEGETGDGRHHVTHQVQRYSDGSASSTCTIRAAEGGASGTGSYYYGQTGQPGADCFLELAGAQWRLTLAQDERSTIVSQKKSWLVPCHAYAPT